MSKLIQKLKDAANLGGQPMGFRAHVATRAPDMTLIARLPGEEVSLFNSQANADAVLLDLKGAFNRQQLMASAQRFNNIPWGALLETVTKEEAAQLAELGCDFIGFPPAGTPLSILEEKDMGKILVIPSTMEISMAAAINEMPMDAVLIRSDEEPFLTVQSLMSIQRLSEILQVPALAFFPPESSGEELKVLKMAGICGVILAAEPEGVGAKIKELRRAIADLPLEGKKQPSHRTALLPSTGFNENLSTDDEI